jgi:hypothetical protein
MKDKEIIDILISCKRIAPRDEFSRTSRKLVLASPRKNEPAPDAVGTLAGVPRGWADTLSYGLHRSLRIAVFAVAGLAVLATSYLATRELSPLFLPGLNAQRISAEADMIDAQIDIQLSKLDHFKQTSSQSATALHYAARQDMDHLNEPIIQKETNTIENTIAQTPAPASQVNEELNDIIDALGQ